MTCIGGRALLPDLVKFAYIPQNQLRIHGDSSTVRDADSKRRRGESPDFSAFASGMKGTSTEDEDEVLILEFAENSRGKKNANLGWVLSFGLIKTLIPIFDELRFSYTAPPSLTPAALKKLVEKRNERFSEAVDEFVIAFFLGLIGLTDCVLRLIRATPETEDPVILLQTAGHDHIPINPSTKGASRAFSEVKEKGDITIPDSKDRASVDAVLTEIEEQSWYKCQIVHKRVIEEKPGQLGGVFVILRCMHDLHLIFVVVFHSSATLDPPLSDSITQALRDSRKISSLYSHQVAAITALDEGKNVIVSTSTASGKSVIYQVSDAFLTLPS